MNQIAGFSVAFVVFVIGIFMAMLFVSSMDKQEMSECQKWRMQSETMSGFYLLEWQKDQCKAHGIDL